MEFLILIPILLLLILPSIMMSRRQRARMNEIQQLQNSLQIGDRVVTTAGQHATVVGLYENQVDLEVAPGVVTTWERISVVQKAVDPSAEETLDHPENFSIEEELPETGNSPEFPEHPENFPGERDERRDNN